MILISFCLKGLMFSYVFKTYVLAQVSKTWGIIEIHFCTSFVLTAVYDLQWKYRLKVGEKLAELRTAIVLMEGLLDRHSTVVSECLIREAFLALSMAPEKEQLTVFRRGMKREWERRGQKGQSSQGRKAPTYHVNRYRLVCLPHAVTRLSA